MTIKSFITGVLKSYTQNIDEWTLEWEKDENTMKSMQKTDNELNSFNLALALAKSNSRVLSAGCGPGREVKMLVAKKCKVTAIDRSKNMIDKSRKFEPHAKYLLGDIVNYQNKEKYDQIFCLFNTMNYLGTLERRKEFIGNSFNNLKKKGV